MSYIWSESIWKPQDDCHDSNGRAPCLWRERTDPLPMAEVIALVITSNFCYCQHHWANIDLDEKAGSLWDCSYISQSINKIPNVPSSEWWGNKGVDRSGHQVWNPASNCVLHVEYQIKVKKKSWENWAKFPCARLNIIWFSNFRPSSQD